VRGVFHGVDRAMDVARRQVQSKAQLSALIRAHQHGRALAMSEHCSFQPQRQRDHMVGPCSVLAAADRLRLLRRQPDHALHEGAKVSHVSGTPQAQLARGQKPCLELGLTPIGQVLAQYAHPSVVHGARLQIAHTRDNCPLPLVVKGGGWLPRAAQPLGFASG
jgi:hypothetical protein